VTFGDTWSAISGANPPPTHTKGKELGIKERLMGDMEVFPRAVTFCSTKQLAMLGRLV